MGDLALASGHEQWAEPAVNWFDHFINRAKLRDAVIVEGDAKDRGRLRELFIQFVDQAVSTEKETEALIAKKYAIEDISFNERKSACLWLCAFACFASLDYIYDINFDNFEEVLTIKSVYDRMDTWAATQENGWRFGSWLQARWVLQVDSLKRVPPPPAKQTVNNPLSVPDRALMQFDAAERAVAEIRERLPDAQMALELLISAAGSGGQGMEIPGPACFLQPFQEETGKSLRVGLAGMDVLMESSTPPQPRLKEAVTQLPLAVLVRKCRLDLVKSYMQSMQLRRSLEHLEKLVHSLSELSLAAATTAVHPLASLDIAAINGYCAAFRLPPALPITTASTSSTAEESTFRTRREVMNKASKAPAVFVDQAISDAECGIPAVHLLTVLQSPRLQAIAGTLLPSTAREEERPELLQAVLKALSEAMRRSSTSKDSLLLRALVNCISATVPGTRELFTAEGVPSSCLSSATRIGPLLAPPTYPAFPSIHALRALAERQSASDQPFWTLITSFDLTELKAALTAVQADNRLGAYRRPILYKFPDLLSEVIFRDPSRPFNELTALLLAKLQQLCDVGDQGMWEKCVNQYARDIGASTSQEIMQRVIYEACHVQCVVQSASSLNPNSVLDQEKSLASVNTIKNLKNTTQHPSLIAPMISFLLNVSQWDHVMQRLECDARQVTVNAARVLAAYGQQGADVRQLVAAWHNLVSPAFEAPLKRLAEGGTSRDIIKKRLELQQLLTMIKEPRLLAFLLSYFCHLYSQALALRDRSHLRVFVELSGYFNNGISLARPCMDALNELLIELFRTAELAFPDRVPWLRSRADFYYVRNELEMAGSLYCELLFTARPSLIPPFDHPAIDDSVWSHLRQCLRRKQLHTLAACVCQLFKTGRAKEYRRAADAIGDRLCEDASDDCFGFIFDVQLAEYLSDAFAKKGLQEKVERLLNVIAEPVMNANNQDEVVKQERKTRTARLLRAICSQYFATHF